MKLIDNLWQDLGYALRHLKNNPRFALLAVLIMALGIGANTAVFSVVNQVILKPLAFPEPDRIVALSTLLKPGTALGRQDASLISQVAIADVQAWHDEGSAFQALALYATRKASVMAGAVAENAQVTTVGAEFFDVFATQPVIGRTFSAEEVKPNGPPAAVISYSYWQNHFGGSASILGQIVLLQNRSLPVVGVMPPGFQFPDDTEIWFPTRNFTAAIHGLNYKAVARLKSGISLEQGRSQLIAVSSELEKRFADSNTDRSVAVTPLSDSIIGDLRLTVFLLWAAVGVVLLVACANTATLLLARSAARTSEIAVRAAVGATRARVIRQLLTENLVLSLISGSLGLLIAQWSIRILIAAAPANLPRLSETTIDGRVLAFTIAVSMITSVVFGLVPAFHASKLDLNEALKQNGSRLLQGGRTARMRTMLVTAEIAFSVLLLCTAGLLVRSFVALNTVALGFQPENVLLVEARAAALGWPGANPYFQNVLSEISRLPGVVAVGGTMAPPGRMGNMGMGPYWPDHLPAGGMKIDSDTPSAVMSVVTPGFLNALGIHLKSGRDFDSSDTETSARTVIINETLARQAFPGQDPVGRNVVCAFDSTEEMRIIGVAADTRQVGPARPPMAECYMSYRRTPYNGAMLTLAIRTTGSTTGLAESVRRVSRQAAPEVSVEFLTMDSSLAENKAVPRFRTLLIGIFAALAVGLAIAGVYSVVSYAVGQRSREIGLRMAMGATPRNIQSMVLRQGLVIAAAGVLFGLAGAFAATRLIAKMLFGIQANDPLTYISVCMGVVLVTLTATYFPARRAATIDPMTALRQN